MAARPSEAKTLEEVGAAEGWKASRRSLLVTQFFMAMSTSMAMPARMPMVLDLLGGDTAKAAKVLSLQSSLAAALGLLMNPLLGNFSDRFGRRPALLIALILVAVPHGLVTCAPRHRILWMDRLVSGAAMEAFMPLIRASLSDLMAGASFFASAIASQGAAIGAGMVLGSFVGARLGGARAFGCSAATISLTACWLGKTLPETLPQEKRKLRLVSSNPFVFLRLFKDRSMAYLTLTCGLQSFADIVNIIDVTQVYLRKVLGYGQAQIGDFITLLGLTRTASGIVTPVLLRRLGQSSGVLLANSATVLSLCLLGTARSTTQVVISQLVLSLGVMRDTAVTAFLQKRGTDSGMGQGEVAACAANFLSLIRVLAPMISGRIFSWANSKGRNLPGLPYFFPSLLVVLSQFTFRRAVQGLTDGKHQS